jgi:hypothetical protein
MADIHLCTCDFTLFSARSAYRQPTPKRQPKEHPQ